MISGLATSHRINRAIRVSLSAARALVGPECRDCNPPPPQTHEGVQQSDKRRRSHDADFGCDVVGQSVDHVAQVSNDKSQHPGNGGIKKGPCHVTHATASHIVSPTSYVNTCRSHQG